MSRMTENVKVRTFVLQIFFFLWIFLCATAQANLLQNPGFEENAGAAGSATHWTNTGNTGVEDWAKHTDIWGMATYGWGPVENGTIYQDVPATENTDYVYSMWVSGDGGSAGNYYMKVEWYAGETLLDSNSLDITAVVNGATWVEASLDAASPAGCDTARVMIDGVNFTSCGKFDDASFTPTIAHSPSPADNANYMGPDTDIGWSAGIYAASHDVYFGTDFNDVNEADAAFLTGDVNSDGQVDLADISILSEQWLTIPGGSPSADIAGDSSVNLLDFAVMANDWMKTSDFKGNQTATSFEPGIMDMDTTYYWRIDEVNGVDMWKGDVWSFTVSDLPVIATGHDSRIDLRWPFDANVDGYNIYRSASALGPFTKINSLLHTVSVYSDFFGTNDETYFYYVTTVVNGEESGASGTVSATSYAMTDDELLTSVQESHFRYFWDFANPISGTIREGYVSHGTEVSAAGGTGMGLMNICVGVERGFITRQEAAERVLKMLNFLDQADRFHGAWPHWFDGGTGDVILFGGQDGGDIVETSYIAQGMLTVRQYFDNMNDATEADINDMATDLWESIDWNFYTNGSNNLQWLWSPTVGFNLPDQIAIHGYNECMITYLLAIASPTHPIPVSCYYDGWCNDDSYENGNSYYGYKQWVGYPYGGPLFFTHYTSMGFDPRDKSDNYCNYFENNRNISLINRAWCAANPGGFDDYSNTVWGLTASFDPWDYGVHEPLTDSDNGTISPTAAMSAMAYTPAESIATMKEFYFTYGADLWSPFGFYDAFNPTQNWYADNCVAIDQGPIAVMIENYRTGLCWDLFMANPEITPMLNAIGWQFGKRSPDNPASVVNGLDYEYYHGTWSNLPDFDLLTPVSTGTVTNFSLTPKQQNDYFAFRFTGYIDVPTDAGYTFYTESDDGSQLYIGDKLVVDNDGLHGMVEKSGYIALEAGKHAITVTFFENAGGEDLIVRYASEDITKTTIPDSVLYRDD